MLPEPTAPVQLECPCEVCRPDEWIDLLPPTDEAAEVAADLAAGLDKPWQL